VEVEVEDPGDVKKVAGAGVDRILLDNMSPGDLRKAVKRVKGRVAVEASGGVTLDNVREVADAGVDFISVGALTHSAPALDLSLLLAPR
jgi:nicotinate-nucleotide pyrophosphorylase (carboxylating)